MKVGIVSLGCAKNRVDSEVMLGLLTMAGHDIVSKPEEAEAIIINTCGFIGPAKEESINAVLDMAKHKQQGPCRALIVTGCLSQRYGQELFAELPEVDAMIGVSDYGRIAEILERATGERFLLPGGLPNYVENVRRVLTTASHTAYVKLADGCDNRCSYCAIPGIRGPFRSRRFEGVLAECESLLKAGVVELNLIAQDTTRYGEDIYGETRLPELLSRVAELNPQGFTRALYCYPKRVDEKLLSALCLPGVCGYLDVPIQHAGDALLASMNRRGTSAELKWLHGEARSRGLTLRTTVICGFPGETEADFDHLLAFLREYPFDRLGAFPYSPEESTPAADMPNQVPFEVAQRRVMAIMEQQEKISRGLLAKRVGNVEKVLIEGRRGRRYFGRSAAEAPESDGVVLVESNETLITGAFASVKIREAFTHDVLGVAQ